jgi:hypothetical protein
VNFETEPTLQPGMEESAIDTATDASHTITEVSAGLQAAVNRLSEAIAAARLPGRPLSIISTITGSAAREPVCCILVRDISRAATPCRWPSHGVGQNQISLLIGLIYRIRRQVCQGDQDFPRIDRLFRLFRCFRLAWLFRCCRLTLLCLPLRLA